MSTFYKGSAKVVSINQLSILILLFNVFWSVITAELPGEHCRPEISGLFGVSHASWPWREPFVVCVYIILLLDIGHAKLNSLPYCHLVAEKIVL